MFKTTVGNPLSAEARVQERAMGERSFLLLLAALTALTALSIDMSLPAMPQLQSTFHTDVAAVQLTLSLFLVGFAAGQLVCGPLSDRKGRRPVLLAGLALFAGSGLACAASPSLPWLVFFRLLQGMGASVGPILARAMVRDRFDARHTASVLSQITQVMILAPLLAPTMGAYLLTGLGWQAIFATLGGSGLLIWLICWRRLPETLRRREETDLPQPGVAAGLRSVLSHRESLYHALTVCVSYAGLFAYISGSPFVFIDAFGVDKHRFGLFFAMTAGSLLIGATVNRALLPRIEPSVLLRRGVLLVFGGGVVLLLLSWFRIGGLVGVLAPMMVYMFGLGLVQPNATAAAMAPHGRLAGVTSSVIGGMQTAGGAAAGFFVGAFYDHSSFSLAATVVVLAVLTLLMSSLARQTVVRQAALEGVSG